MIAEDTKSEYRVLPVTRFIVTRHRSTEHTGECEQLGEFDNKDMAFNVAYAVANSEARDRGLEQGDERVIFPKSVAELCRQSARAMGAPVVAGPDNFPLKAYESGSLTLGR